MIAASLALAPAPSQAAFDDPLFVFTPPPPDADPPYNFKAPCGLAVDSSGDFYVSNHYNRSVEVFRPPPSPFLDPPEKLGSAVGPGDTEGPCGLDLDSSTNLYLNDYHRNVTRFPAPVESGTATVIDSGYPTGVAVDPATDRVYVNARTHLTVYEPSGAPVEVGGSPLRIGAGSLQDGYGIAVSGFPATAGYVYAPDAATDTVKVYDPATSTEVPVQTISGPPGGFVSLTDSAVAVDDAGGDIYVVDARAIGHAPRGPRAVVHVFGPSGAFEGRLKHDVISAAPVGLAVDNSGGPTQGRAYVTSGNSEHGSVYAYPPAAATAAAAPPLDLPPRPALGQLIPQVPIGGETPPEPSPDIACVGDACQILPSPPGELTLTTTLQGLGNPGVAYVNLLHRCRPLARQARRLARQARRLRQRAGHGSRLLRRAERLSKRSRRLARRARHCAGPGGGPAVASSHSGQRPARPMLPGAEDPPDTQAGSAGPPARALTPGFSGFEAAATGDAGEPATLAGSHPYDLSLTFGAGSADLRSLSVELPAGLLANLTAVPPCSQAAFATPRSSPFELPRSGENCPDRTQLGTIEVQTGAGAGESRRFGLFSLAPKDGTASRFGAAPYAAPGDLAAGEPLIFDTFVTLDPLGGYAQRLLASEIPQGLQLRGLDLTLWGVPWDAAHNGERGDCLNTREPGFPWAKCSLGSLQGSPPMAYLTMPTECRASLSFRGGWSTWQDPSPQAATALNRSPLGDAVAITGCESLEFEPEPHGLLSGTRAGSPSGFVFRLQNEVDRGLLDPYFRIQSHARDAELELPDGASINAGLAGGLAVCRPPRFAAESATGSFGAGCPTESKIGDFTFRTPLYNGFLEGSIYLAQPDDKSTLGLGAENPFDSLLAVYFVAKSAQRGFLIKLAGRIAADPGTGAVTATIDGLPQFPYTDLEAIFSTGQRAPLVSPPRCGSARTRTTALPWSGGLGVSSTAASVIDTGPDAGPCPDGSTPPFAPTVTAGGVNSNVGSYTPYFVRISRRDSEQQLTSYSLTLPRGITGKLAGIPFCPEAAIEAARTRGGFQEVTEPSCPAASRVGRTLTSYAVGNALAYAPGGIYLAGPYNGQPLSLVTINSAAIGAFDLGTIVIRSAFKIDPRTAQLEIDSGASDPIPHIIDGFPLNLRDVRVYIDRPGFTRNPTGCGPSALTSTLTGSGAALDAPSDNSSTAIGTHFQLLNCLELGFGPQLGLRLRGATRRGAYPQLRAVLQARDGDASLRRIAISMPHSLFLAQSHIRQICTRPEFNAENCPPGSVYGHAALHTPLFDQPLTGPIVLRSSDSALPDLVATLRSGAVRIVLEGQIGPSNAGGIRAFFDEIPDAPIDRFVMQLDGGNRGLLQNSVDICRVPPEATVKALGHNNRGVIYSTELRGRCEKRRPAGKAKGAR